MAPAHQPRRLRRPLAAHRGCWRQPHGEADLVFSYGPRCVLDGGCGTGRVAIELSRRGVEVVGVDLDRDMIELARAKAPDLTWINADLGELGELALATR